MNANINNSIVANDKSKIKNASISNDKKIEIKIKKEKKKSAIVGFIVGILTSVIGSYFHEILM